MCYNCRREIGHSNRTVLSDETLKMAVAVCKLIRRFIEKIIVRGSSGVVTQSREKNCRQAVRVLEKTVHQSIEFRSSGYAPPMFYIESPFRDAIILQYIPFLS